MAMNRTTRMMVGKAASEARLPGLKMEIEYETWGEPENRFRDRQGRPHYNNGRYAPRSNWDDGMPARMGYEAPESRFRDRRGREHYDNGRYAPRAGGDWYGPYGGEEDGEMRPIGFNSNWGGEMHGGADASIPRYNEMDRLPGNRATHGGYMAGDMEYGKMDEQTALAWARGMRNEDGSKTPHWTMDQVRQVMSQKGLDMDLPEFFAILNALYSDYDPVFKRHNVSTMDFYVDMAKAWLKDKDAVPNKAMAYYECIVKR